jgi:hypothetical protein
MRILDQSDDIAKWIRNGSHLDVAADVFHRRHDDGTLRQEVGHCRVDRRHTPVRGCATRPGLAFRDEVQAQLVGGDVEADIERLVEVRLLLKYLRIGSVGSVGSMVLGSVGSMGSRFNGSSRSVLAHEAIDLTHEPIEHCEPLEPEPIEPRTVEPFELRTNRTP